MTYDFSNLTDRQQSLLTFQGWEPGHEINPQPGPRTVKKLLERGLLVEHETSERVGPFTMTVRTYSVPTDVHIAWCAHCAMKTKNRQ